MSQVLLCPKCGHEMNSSTAKCNVRDCLCFCGAGHGWRSIFEDRADRQGSYDVRPNMKGR